MSTQLVLVENYEDISLVTINRPEALNALNSLVLKELDAIIDTISKNSNIRAVIITGAGEKAFVAGADIAEMKDMSADEAKEFSSYGNAVFRKIESLPVPVIAAVNGFALGGGCELAMACDMRFASANAKFGQPETGLGIIPGFGGTQRLSRLVGAGYAKELIFTGKVIRANEALRIGLVNNVYETGLLDEVKKVAAAISAQAPIAVKLAKASINDGIHLDIGSAVKLEADNFAQCFSTQDQKEGMSAFLEKREKTFRNM
jgi:enoyl-CoA hydratase